MLSLAKSSHPALTALKSSEGHLAVNKITKKIIPAGQGAHDHATINVRHIQVSSGGTPTITTTQTAPVTYKITPSDIPGKIKKIYVRCLLTVSTDVVAIQGPKILTDVVYSIGSQKIGTWPAEALWVETALDEGGDTDLQAYLTLSNGMGTTWGNGHTIQVGTFNLFVDITGPFRSGAINPSTLDETITIQFAFNATTPVNGFATLTGTVVLTSHQLRVFYESDPDAQANDRYAMQKGMDIVYLMPQLISNRTVSGTSELARTDLDNFKGISPFAVFMVQDVSADIGASSQALSAISQIKVNDTAGIRVLSDSDDPWLINELWMHLYDIMGKGVSPFYGSNTILYPFCKDPRDAIFGKIDGYYKFTGGGESATLTSTDSNADNLRILMYHFRVMHFMGGKLKAISDM